MRRKFFKICLSGLLLSIIFPVACMCQNTASVNGVVTNENGEPLENVTVNARNTVNKQYQYNALTDSIGAFYFTDIYLDGKYSFTFSRVGYKEHTITGYTLNADGNTSIIIKLAPDSSALENVVVTGFQKIDKSRFTGSVVQVDKELMNRSGYMDVSKMLQGVAAGVSVSSPSGTFGATPKIRIRGNASISANQEPLYVLNGVPISSPANVSVGDLYSGDPASLLSSVIAGLNANDIEDISILKDGSATALYGTRAANGIISITTKKGRKGASAISLSSAFTLGLKPDISHFNLMDSKQQIDLAKSLYDYGYLSVVNYPSATGAFTDAYDRYARNLISYNDFNREMNDARYVNANWFDVLFRNNLMQEHSLSLSGGGEGATYYLSGSYAGDDGAAIGYNTKRYTTDMRTIFNITRKFDLDVDVSANFRNQMAPGTFKSTVSNTTSDITRPFELNPTLYATTTSRAMTAYNQDGSYKYYLRNYAPFNILDELNENFTRLYTQNVSISVRPTYRVTQDLTLEVLLSARKNNSKVSHVMTEYSNVAAAYRTDYPDPVRDDNPYLYKDPTDPYAVPATILPKGGILEAYNSQGTELYGRATLNYSKKINDNHRVTLFGGVELRSNNYTADSSKAYGYSYYGGKIISPSLLAMKYTVLNDNPYYKEAEISERAIGIFGNLQYTLKNRYNIDLMARSDGSNVFGRSNRSRFLPNYNVGISWNVDREPFLEAINKNNNIDYITLRASYALRGNAYMTSPTLNGRFYNAVRVDNNEIGIDIISPELYNLAWEKDFITNIGLDVSFLKRFSFVAEYYQRENRNLIAPSSMPFEEGFGNKVINWASMSNKGIDLTLNITNILNSKKFRWGAGVIYSYVKNTMIDGVLQSPLLSNITNPQGFGKIGKPLYGLYAYNFGGLDENGQPTFAIGNTGRTVNNILLTNTNDSLVSYMGPREPTTTGSFSNSFAYGPIELRIFFTYSYGNKVFRSPIVRRTYTDNLAAAQDLDARWRSSGDEDITNIPGLLSNVQAAYLSTAGIQNEFAYNRSNIMVAKADVLRLSEIMMSYDFNPRILQKTRFIKSLRITGSANNIYYWADKKLRGIDPESLITGVALPNPKSYSLRILAQF